MDEREKRLYALLGTAVHVEVDRPIGTVHKGMVYPVNYGYVPGMPGGDGEEQDAYILGVDTPLERFDGRVVGAIRRRDDCEDKLIVAPEGMVFHQGQIAEAVHFQEQYFDTFIVSAFRKSCGVLPYRVVDSQREYLLVFEQFSQCWSLPKGHMEAGETEEQTALRELFEEIGLTAVLDAGISASVEYPVFSVARKQVVFFPGQVSGTPRVREGEIEHFRWVKAHQLKDHLFPDTARACMELIRKAK